MKWRSTHRPGYALIELVGTITIMTILLALCAGMLHILLKLDQAGRDALDLASDQARLGRMFRADAHQSSSIGSTIVSDCLTLNLTASTQIDYSVRPQHILREVRRGTQILQRELFRRSPRSLIRFEVKTTDDDRLAAINIDQPDRKPTVGTQRTVRIEAEIGRFKRWVGEK